MAPHSVCVSSFGDNASDSRERPERAKRNTQGGQEGDIRGYREMDISTSIDTDTL